MKRKLSYIILIFLTSFSFSQSNVQNENNVQNTYLMKLNHYAYNFDNNLSQDDNPAQRFFEPYMAYYDNLDNPIDYMMDSFIFSDNFYLRNGYDGIFRKEDMDYYLNNVFVRTKLPFIDDESGNHYAKIENKRFPVLSYKIPNSLLNTNTTYTVSYNIRKVDKSFTECLDCDGDGNYSYTSPCSNNATSEFFSFGIQYYDSDGGIIVDSANCPNLTPGDIGWTTNGYNMCYDFDTSVPNVWTNESFSFSTPSSFEPGGYIKLRFINFNGFEKEIHIDNVTINNILLASSSESTFENIDLSTTNWEYERTMRGSNNYSFLFEDEDRTPLIEALKNARVKVDNTITGNTSLDNDTIKIILILPRIDAQYNNCEGQYTSYYNDLTKKEALKLDIINYINTIVSKITSWNSTNNSGINIEVAGLYYIDEDIRDDAKLNIIKDILVHTRDELHSKGWEFFGSPFWSDITNGSKCISGTSYSALNNYPITDIFDLVWQQPNAFFRTNKDRDLLESTLVDVIRTKRVGINIESAVLNFNFLGPNISGENYGRVLDYFDYGYKLGYINYPKLYFDSNGAHYSNKFSNIEAERIDYNNLYNFINRSIKGEVVNNRFEYQAGASTLFNWIGNYQIEENTFSTSSIRTLEFQTDTNTQHNSERIPVLEGEKYYISFQIKDDTTTEICNTAFVGVNFYDNNGLELSGTPGVYLPNSNIRYSSTASGINAYFNAFDGTSTFTNKHVYFTVPNDAVEADFFIRYYNSTSCSSTGTTWKDVKIHNASLDNEPQIFYTLNNNASLTKERLIKNGTKSVKLAYNDYIESEEQISVNNNKDYVISIDTKELLPIKSLTDNSKAYIGLKAYDFNGALITDTSQVIGLNTSLSGGDTFWVYISDIKQNWSTFTTNKIVFGDQVASVRLVIKNWFYDNTLYIDNVMLEYFNNDYQINTNVSGNLLNKVDWNESFPATAIRNQPLYYRDLINVDNINQLEFSAYLKNEDDNSSNNSRLLTVEFLDSEFNLIDTGSNLSQSQFYNYWYDNYNVSLQYDECSLVLFNGPVNSSLNGTSQWYFNKWELFETEFTTPANAKWMRIAIHNFNTLNELRILNPVLKDVSVASRNGAIGENYKTYKPEGLSDGKNLVVYPNPAKDRLYVDLNKLDVDDNNLDYFIYDITGKLINQGLLVEKKSLIDVSSLNQGIYFIKLSGKGNSIMTKIIISK